MVNETTSGCGQYMALYVSEKLSEDEPKTLYLIACKILRTNCSTVAHFVSFSWHLLWPEGRNSDKFYVFHSELLFGGSSYCFKVLHRTSFILHV
jgi:hypothetical protein